MRLIAATALALSLLGSPADAQQTMHKIVDPASIKWGPGPTSMQPGVKSALLYGDPTKPELFIMRLKFPKGFRVAPHTHPRPEILTLISGAVHFGTGQVADRGKTHLLRAGSFSALGPNMPHFSYFDQETVIQISTTGPWSVTYINPADDPRIKH